MVPDTLGAGLPGCDGGAGDGGNEPGPAEKERVGCGKGRVPLRDGLEVEVVGEGGGIVGLPGSEAAGARAGAGEADVTKGGGEVTDG